MRLEHAGPRTRLLALLAGLALLAWFATLAGAGERVALLPDDPALLPPLPAAGGEAAPALQPLSAYAVIAERPLFSIDRTPRPFFLSGHEAGIADGGFDYQLTSVILTPSLRMAILQPAGGGEAVRVREGAEPPGAAGWRLVGLDRRSAVFEGPEGRRSLALRVFDGTGGAAPAPRSPEAAQADMASAGAPAGSASGADAGAEDPAPDAHASAAATDTSDQASAADTYTDAPEPDAARLDAIRQRIQARRARLQQQAGQ